MLLLLLLFSYLIPTLSLSMQQYNQRVTIDEGKIIIETNGIEISFSAESRDIPSDKKIHDEQHNDLPRADCEICMKRVQDFHRFTMKAIHDVYEHDVKPWETCEYCKKNVEDEKNL